MNNRIQQSPDKWHVLYTRPRHEKKLKDFLAERGIQVYLPLYKTIRQWSDRKKKVEEPLFRSYLFVKADELNYFIILNAPGAVRFVHFGKEIATISNGEVEMIERILKYPDRVEVEDFTFYEGEKVKIKAGPFKGIEGTLISIKGGNRLIMQIEQLGKNLVIDVPSFNVHLQAKPVSC